MKEQLTNMLEFLGFAWWVEIITEKPICTYYFGPFVSYEEAADAKDGYIEDLEEEGAEGISAVIKRCKPSELTIFDELGELIESKASPVYG